MFLVFFVAVHLIGMALIAAIQPFGRDAAQRNIQHQTGCNAKHDFEHQQQAQLVPQGRLRRQQGMASSDVARNTASSVPGVMTRLA